MLSEAKLQRIGRSPRSTLSNLGSFPNCSDEKLRMFESLASCFAFRGSASFNMTAGKID